MASKPGGGGWGLRPPNDLRGTLETLNVSRVPLRAFNVSWVPFRAWGPALPLWLGVFSDVAGLFCSCGQLVRGRVVDAHQGQAVGRGYRDRAWAGVRLQQRSGPV